MPILVWTKSCAASRNADWEFRLDGKGPCTQHVNFSVRRTTNPQILALCFCCLLAFTCAAQQQAPEDPEDDKQVGLWLDQGISTPLSASKSLDVEIHERFDEGGTNLYEYFFQGGLAFRLRPWFTVIPIYRYQRYPANPKIAYENRLRSI